MAFSAWRPNLKRQPQIVRNLALLWRISIPTLLIFLLYSCWLWAELQVWFLDAYDAVDTAILDFENISSQWEGIVRWLLALAYTELWIDMLLLVAALLIPVATVILIMNWTLRFLAKIAWEYGRTRSLWAMVIATIGLVTLAFVLSLLSQFVDEDLQQYVGFLGLVALSLIILIAELLRKTGRSSDA